MKEGTVSSGVALRPRPTEVQPHFLGSKKIIWNFFMNYKCHVSLPTSVTILFLFVTFNYRFLLPNCYLVTFNYRLLLPFFFFFLKFKLNGK